MFVVAVVLSLSIGLALGMLGGGGAILTLPMLVYVAKVEPKTAIAVSLFVVGSTSLVGSTFHARAGAVRWKLGLLFGLAAMAGAFGAGRVAHLVPATALLVLFAIIMIVTATAMLRGRRGADDAQPRPLALVRVLALGATVGIVSGLVGAGGGFLIVPALTLFGGLSMRDAIGTSLFVIALQSFAGFAGHVTHVEIPWRLAGAVTGAAVLASVAGAFLAKRVSAASLRRGFGWLVLGMGLFVLGKQLPLALAVLATALVALAVFLLTRPKPRLVPE